MTADGDTKLKRGMLWNSIGSLFYFGCQWLTTILVVRLSSSYEAAGTLSLAMAIANLFTPFALYRMRTFQVTDVNDEFCTGEYMGFRIETSSIALAACIIYSVFTCPGNTVLPITCFLILKFVEQIIDVMHGLDQKNGYLEYAGKSLLIRGFLTVGCFSGSLIIAHNLSVAFLSMALVSLAFAFIYDVPKASQFDSLAPIFSKRVFAALFKTCFPIVIASILSGAVMTIPKQLIGSILGHDYLGIYSSNASPVAVVQLGASYLYSPLLGVFAESFQNGDTKSFSNLFRKLSAMILITGLIGSVTLRGLAPIYLGLLFGNSIIQFSYLIIPMVLCTLVTAYYQFISDVLLATREYRWNSVAGVVAFIISIPLSYALIGSFGMNGVSFTGIASYAISALLSIVAMSKQMSRRVSA